MNKYKTRIYAALRNIFRREIVERDLDAEVRSYADLLQEEKMSTGMNPNDAKRSTRMSMGGPEQLKEEIRRARAGAWLETLWQDIRYAARMLRKNPAFTAVAILTLALGIGANTAVFSVVDAVVLRPLPYKDSERIVTVTTKTTMFPQFSMLGNSWVAFEQMTKNVTAFEQLSAYRQEGMTLTASGDPASLTVIHAADGFFDLFGVSPQEGRLLASSDQTENQGRVAVLSDAFWRAHFGADRSVIGRTITLSKEQYVVVGVASRGFAYPRRADIWVPLVLTKDDRENVTAFNNVVLGKIRPGATVAQTEVQLDVVAQDIVKANPPLKDGYKLHATTLLDDRIGDVRSTYLMLFGAASFVLLIACANLASLLLARGFGRQREMAVRAALGASRGRIIRQSLVESCLLGLLGGVAGAIFASIGVSLFRQIAPADTPRLSEIAVGSAMFWFALGSSLLAGILFGLAPALRASRSDPNAALKNGVGGSVPGIGGTKQPRLGGVLVIAEVALAFILLIGAVVTTEGLTKLLKTDTGMRIDHLLTFDLPLPQVKDENVDAVHAKIQDVLERARALPGVANVTATDHNVLGGFMMLTSGFTVEGVPAQSTAERTANVRYVSPSYFQMLGVHLIHGRFFNEHDVSNSEKVVIVNEAMAQHLWNTTDVVGKRISMMGNMKMMSHGQTNDWTIVAGVVANTRDVSLDGKPKPEFYFPILQGGPLSLHIIIRTEQDPNALASVVSRQIWTADKDQPITHVATMDHLINEQIGDTRMQTALLNFFGAIGLGLALLGVYGVVAYSVSRRTREIGIRIALGANRFHVLRMVIRQGMLLALIGVAIGAAGAVALKQVLQNNFTVANTNDVTTYLVAGVLVIFVACLACYVPARRAMRVDPMVALRYE
jgi:putative ABC transport system permease protein